MIDFLRGNIGRQLATGLVPVPDEQESLTGVDTVIMQIVVANVSDNNVTFSVVDGNDNPLIPSKVILAKDVVTFSFGQGVLMLGGVSWVAGEADALFADVFGYMRGV